MTIREILTDITGVGNKDKLLRWHDASRFKNEVMPILPSPIEVIELPPGQQFQFNCFTFALELRCISAETPFTDGFIYSPFVEKLIAEKAITKLNRPPAEGDVVFYWNGVELKHAGKISRNDMIISKWSGGPILKHPLLYVPVDYGEKNEYYEGISEKRAKQLFFQHTTLKWLSARQTKFG